MSGEKIDTVIAIGIGIESAMLIGATLGEMTLVKTQEIDGGIRGILETHEMSAIRGMMIVSAIASGNVVLAEARRTRILQFERHDNVRLSAAGTRNRCCLLQQRCLQ